MARAYASIVLVMDMATEAQNRANRKYKEKTYDRLELQLKKGMKEVYRAQAAAHGLSLNAYIISLLEKDALPEPALSETNLINSHTLSNEVMPS